MYFIKVKVKTSSKKDEVVRSGEDAFLVSVRSKPKLGEANKSIVDLIASFIGVPRSKLKIIKGSRSPSKIILIRDD